MRVYKLEELKEIDHKGYIKAIRWFKEQVGASSEEAAIRYSSQAGWVFTTNGRAYKRVY